jgi:ABC-2 type transport system ATP-binding protein
MREGELLADEAPQALLERAGTDDIETAFLTLIDQKAGAR